MADDFNTKKISSKLINEVISSIQNIRGWGTVEIIIQDHLVTQITEKNIRKPLLSNGQTKTLQALDFVREKHYKFGIEN